MEILKNSNETKDEIIIDLKEKIKEYELKNSQQTNQINDLTMNLENEKCNTKKLEDG